MKKVVSKTNTKTKTKAVPKNPKKAKIVKPTPPENVLVCDTCGDEYDKDDVPSCNCGGCFKVICGVILLAVAATVIGLPIIVYLLSGDF